MESRVDRQRCSLNPRFLLPLRILFTLPGWRRLKDAQARHFPLTNDAGARIAVYSTNTTALEVCIVSLVLLDISNCLSHPLGAASRDINMLIKPTLSTLLMVDLQECLGPAIENMQVVVENNLWLAQVARRLGVPVVATVQYPAGLGPMLPSLSGYVDELVEKIHFSAVADGCIKTSALWARPQVVLTGTEGHVCVLQTALDLLATGKQVYVVAEATGSRRSEDHRLAIDRMRQEGCRIVSREMVAFEWLQRAGTEEFKQIHREFIR